MTQSHPRAMSADDLVRKHLVARTTRPDDAAERYYCPRTRRTLWVEPERIAERSSRLAHRYLVDNGDGTRTFYMGENLEMAITRLLSVGKPTRERAEVVPEGLAHDDDDEDDRQPQFTAEVSAPRKTVRVKTRPAAPLPTTPRPAAASCRPRSA